MLDINSANQTGKFPVRERGITFLRYVDIFQPGEVLSRSEVAERVERSYSTVLFHLEKAVAEGKLNKAVGYLASGQTGWVYALPATMPKSELLSGDVEQ